MRSDGAAHGCPPLRSVTALRPWRVPLATTLWGPCAASHPSRPAMRLPGPGRHNQTELTTETLRALRCCGAREKRACSVAMKAVKALADRNAANVLPIIREVQKAGAVSPHQIADALNKRGVSTPRGHCRTPPAGRLQQQTLRILAGGLFRHTPPFSRASAHDRLRLDNAAVATAVTVASYACDVPSIKQDSSCLEGIHQWRQWWRCSSILPGTAGASLSKSTSPSIARYCSSLQCSGRPPRNRAAKHRRNRRR
jgi:hypothetical protein